MTEYVLQKSVDTKQLIKCYEVSEDCPIRPIVPEGREQVVITDTELFNEAVAIYAEYKLRAKYTFDGTNVSWEIE